MYINSILSIEATFVNITFQSSKKGRLEWQFLQVRHVRLSEI